MNDRLKSFPERHPFTFNVLTVGIPSLLIFALFILIDPMGFNKLELANRLIMYVMLAILCLFAGLLVGGFFRWISSRSQ